MSHTHTLECTKTRTRPASAGKTGPGKSGVSYEDMLVAQYLEELRKTPQGRPTPTGNLTITSPYLQRFTSTHIVPAPTMNRRPRPQSAKFTSSGKPKVDAKFIADPNLWDPATPRDGEKSRRRRPISAPAYKTRPLSATYGSSRPTSAKYGNRRVRSLYKKQPQTIVVTAFKNGCREVLARVAAPSIKMLLEICTDKLFLPNAARRIFLDDGSEVFTPHEIMREAEVYISMGEPFKNPFKDVKHQTKMTKQASWTMNGLVWTQDSKKRRTKPVLSKRFRSLIEQSRRRVLVFKNGSGSQGVEIVADPDRFEDFLVAVTAKLDLGSYARVLYDWEGNEITNLEDAPVLDQCLQTWTTPVLGPLWVSKGAGFSPKGVNEFLTSLISYTKAKLKEAKHYQRQLQLAQEEDTKDNVEIVAILSMSETEVDEALELVAKDIEEFGNALNHLKEQQEKIKNMLGEEMDEGYQYTLKHIERFESNHRMVGTKGIKLKVYENGTYEDETVLFFNLQQAARGAGHEKDLMMARLLDQCSNSSCLANPKHNPAIRPVAKKLFNNLGKEIKSVYDLEYDQEVWLSFGENFKNPFTFVMSTQFDKVKAVDLRTSESSRNTAFREQLMAEDVKGQEKANQWECVQGLPDEFPREELGAGTDPMTGDIIRSQLENSEISIEGDFLKCKDNPDLLLYGEVVVDTKKPKGSKEIWPSDSQHWIISKAGYIHNKGMAQFVLGVSGQKMSANLGHPTAGPSDSRVEGLVVTLQRKSQGNVDQIWKFSPEGYIYVESQPECALTFLGSRYGAEDTQVRNEEEGTPSGQRFAVAVCEKLEGKDARAQRWAIKQERLDNLGQWKHTQAENPEWNKKAYSWPVTEEGELNEDYDWPMEGFLIPYAPPIRKGRGSKKDPGSAPLRLLTMRNGVRDVSKALAIVGPDLSNMKKDMHHKHDKHGKRKNHRNDGEDVESVEDEMLHCDEDLTVLKLEFILFLERCTSMLDLPFAARRLFDENGKEYFSLRDLKRDQLVYVSCGEPWSDPSLSKAEQQRRYLLANLASDVEQIRQFVSLRKPENLVLEVESLNSGAKVFVAKSALIDEEEEDEEPLRGSVPAHQQEEDPDAMVDGVRDSGKMSSHELAHMRAEERLNRLKWPWERSGQRLEDGGDADGEEQNYSNKELYEKFKTKSRRRTENPSMTMQKFMLEDGGYIACSNSAGLVLAVREQEGRVAEVVLARKKPDDIHQRWILQENGIIQSKHNPQMVLSVSLPAAANKNATAEDGPATTHVGSAVTLQKRRAAQFGRANQRWMLDEETGMIHAFHTDNMDKEITAANKANVCTYAVVGGTEIDQPGYLVEMTAEKGARPKKLLVCSSCARAMRGRYKLEKVDDSVDFACAMGNAKELGVKQIGSFQCLNGKVDLSEHEAEHTLMEWQDQLDKLREELSVRAIAREISAARVPYTVKVLAYKNGEGRLKPGEMIVGSSVPGILDQSAPRLKLTNAARRLYTSDGTIILDVDDLIDWTREQYVKEGQRQLRAEARARRAAKRAGKEGDPASQDLMSKVDFDSSSEEDDEEGEEEEKAADAGGQKAEEPEPTGPFTVGHGESATRKHQDTWQNCVVIPNPTETIAHDGHIVSWKVFAKQEGPVSLQAYRPTADAMTYSLVGQTTFRIPAEGAYSVDITSKGPIEVKRGDVIGMYMPESFLIPYDVNQESNLPPMFMIPVTKPELNEALKMNTWQAQAGMGGMREYSLNATIVPVPKPTPPPAMFDEPPPSEKPKKKKKTKKKSGSKAPHVEPPPVEMILRHPMEVWVSSGEQFVKPERVEKNYEEEQVHREERAGVSYELEKEKHVLRQMQGRRFDEQNPGAYRSTRNPHHPVLIQGHWQEPTLDELQKHDVVHQLQTHLQEMKSVQKQKSLKTANAKTTNRLYTQPRMKRVLVYPNGESLERAVYVWGESLPQLLDNASMRLNLRKPGRYLFNIEGLVVQTFEEVEKDQLVCVSNNKTFLRPKESKLLVEIKANWGRARKKYGPGATDIQVTVDKNPHVDVDPFGPSSISGGPTKQKRPAYSAYARTAPANSTKQPSDSSSEER